MIRKILLFLVDQEPEIGVPLFVIVVLGALVSAICYLLRGG